jgi:hypothetical protein
MSRLIAEIRGQIMATADLPDIEIACAPMVQNLYSSLRDVVRQELEVSIREESEARLQESLGKLREQFMQKIERAGIELEIERRRLREGAGGSQQRDNAIMEELRVKESELDVMNVELTAMIENPDIEIDKMIKHNATMAELKAYVRGLRFQVGDSAKPKAAESASHNASS